MLWNKSDRWFHFILEAENLHKQKQDDFALINKMAQIYNPNSVGEYTE